MASNHGSLFFQAQNNGKIATAQNRGNFRVGVWQNGQYDILQHGEANDIVL